MRVTPLDIVTDVRFAHQEKARLPITTLCPSISPGIVMALSAASAKPVTTALSPSIL